jgi:hypothetical protein
MTQMLQIIDKKPNVKKNKIKDQYNFAYNITKLITNRELKKY